MTRPRLELAEILRAHGETYRRTHPVSDQQSRVMTRIMKCRTAALGGHVEACGNCTFTRIAYNSCRDRHCPKCQAAKQAAWVEARLERLLPVPYFHVVFTIPHALNPVALQNRTLMYDLLFQAASATLLTLAADPRRLGAQIGITAILHTWGQNLLLHPHLHCVVTGGGLTSDGQRWIEGGRRFFLPVKVLAALFRGKFLAGVKALYHSGQLKLTGSVGDLNDAGCFRHWLSALYAQRWVVYAKRPFGGPEQVFRYLGRYTHRVAITNSRLLTMIGGRVAFEWKDYAHGHAKKVMSLEAGEFLRRFLLHVLPKGFVRIRHYGLMASGNVSGKLAWCRAWLEARQPGEEQPATRPSWLERIRQELAESPRCPLCQGELIRIPFEAPRVAKTDTVLHGRPEEGGRVATACCDTS
jgi:hypothetical protein